MNSNKKDIAKVVGNMQPNIDRIYNLAGHCALLEKELSVLQTKLNCELNRMVDYLDGLGVDGYAKADQLKIVETLRDGGRVSFDDLSNAEKSRWVSAVTEFQQLSESKLSIFFDFPQVLQILVSSPDFRSRVIDIVGSIEQDVSNLSNPIILAAVNRYRRMAIGFRPGTRKSSRTLKRTVPLSGETAYFALERIANAIRFKKVPKAPPGLSMNFFKLVSVQNYPHEYFETLARILKSNVVRNSLTVSTKVMHTRIQLKKRFPNVDHKEICLWIENRYRNNNFPNRIESRALSNDFVAWKLGIKRSSAKTYVSLSRRFVDAFRASPTTEKDIEDAVNEAFANLIPTSEMSSEISLLNLKLDDEAFQTILSSGPPDLPVEN